MLINVREGVYDPTSTSADDTLGPNGRELWSATIGDLTITSLRDANVAVEPGEWYELEAFKSLLTGADPNGGGEIYSTVATEHPGVSKPWVTTIEVREVSAVLMVCRSVVEYAERRRSKDQIWLRVE